LTEWYSNQYSYKKHKPKLASKINKIYILFKLPRPTTSTKKDAQGRLFLCLKSTRLSDRQLKAVKPKDKD